MTTFDEASQLLQRSEASQKNKELVRQANYYHIVNENSLVFNESPAEIKEKRTYISASDLPSSPTDEQLSIQRINSSSIDTTLIDPYRQGVELTQTKHVTLGIPKLWSGESDHVLKKSVFGISTTKFNINNEYSDSDSFNPVEYIKNREIEEQTGAQIISYPLVINTDGDVDSLNFDGVIEPLTIRNEASFSNLHFYSINSFKAGLLGGNENIKLSSDRVVTLDYFNVIKYTSGSVVPLYPEAHPSFIDDGYDDYQVGKTGYINYDISLLKPWNDEQLLCGFLTSYTMTSGSSVRDNQMNNILLLMTGSTETYLPQNKFSATCGFVYENNAERGTDSLAYGGQTY